MPRTALVLSAGGMFGAYQAGAWEVLSERFKPDIVIGASIGSLNGWAIAGGCSPRHLSDLWLRARENSIQGIYESYSPRLEFGVIATEWKLKPRLFRSPETGLAHLKASCGIGTIDGSLHIDGGVLHPLPLWAASDMGATEILAINVLPRLPGSWLRAWIWFLRSLAPDYPSLPPSVDLILLEPKTPLGPMRDAFLWNEANARKWLEQGRRDAEELLARLPPATTQSLEPGS